MKEGIYGYFYSFVLGHRNHSDCDFAGQGSEKTFEAMKKSKGMMGNMLGEIVAIIFIIGLVLTLIPPETIKQVLGSANTLTSTVVSALVGSITLIPAFVAFPLVGSLVTVGASIVPAGLS